MQKASTQKTDISQKYKKHTHKEHIFKVPDTYIGSVDEHTEEMWIPDMINSTMVKKNITYIPGLYKIFDEIVVNAYDQYVRLKMACSANQVKNIKLTIDKDSGEISVYNDGEGIDIDVHPEHGIYVPELIFGELLTSTNYNEN